MPLDQLDPCGYGGKVRPVARRRPGRGRGVRWGRRHAGGSMPCGHGGRVHGPGRRRRRRRTRMWRPPCRSAAGPRQFLGGGRWARWPRRGERASRLAVETDSARPFTSASELAGRPGQDRPAAAGDFGRHRGGERAGSRLGDRGLATTLVLVEIRERVVRPYHVGDSATLGRPARQAEVSDDRPFADRLRGRSGADRREGCDPPRSAAHDLERDRLAGDVDRDRPGDPDGPRDTLVLASDGLLDNLLPTEIVELVRTGPLDKAVDQLVAVATERMNAESGSAPSKPDDLTVIAFRPG